MEIEQDQDFFSMHWMLSHTHPQVAIAENVKNLTAKRFSKEFDIVLKSLEEAGYNNYWQVMNSKDYGIPHNRERVFIVSIRKDVDTGLFEFPAPFELNKTMQDFLENDVDEKYFLSKQLVKYVTNPTRLKKSFTRIDGKIALCLTAEGNKNCTGNFVSVPFNSMEDGTCRTIKSQYYKTGPANIYNDNSKGGTFSATGVKYNERIRKLTPKECFRLQGFSDQDCLICSQNGISDTQLYKQAGNSITVDVLEELFCMLFDEDGELFL